MVIDGWWLGQLVMVVMWLLRLRYDMEWRWY